MLAVVPCFRRATVHRVFLVAVCFMYCFCSLFSSVFLEAVGGVGLFPIYLKYLLFFLSSRKRADT